MARFIPHALLSLLIICSAQVTACAEPPQGPAQSLEVYPAKVKLTGPRDLQHLGVLGAFAGGAQWELSRDAKYTSGNPKIAAVDAKGIVRPLTDGATTVTVSARGKTAEIPVQVSKATADIPVDFSREVIPALTRAGCNQGACHGAQHGKGGFRLSLFGFDAAFDYAQIVQSAEGRRVVLSNPEQSIVLLKPTLTLEHAGGQRFKNGSFEYNTIKQWLEDGAPEPTAKDPIVTSLDVWPAKRIMAPGEKQQIIVKATWQDGVVQDVTATAKFDTLNQSVADVTPNGLITAKEKGETYIMIRFSGQVAVVQITLPFAKLDNYPDFPANNFIDEKLVGKWKDLGLTPSPLAGDSEFFRRIHLDTIGTLPTPAEVKAFLADKSPDKRKKAIDKVLNRPEFVDFWALKFGDLLKINRTLLQDRGMWSFHNWVRGSIRDDKPIDQMAKEIIVAEGSTFTEGPANFYMTSRTPAEWAETTSQVFLGVRIGCAKCHHHPFEKWSQDDYYGMSAFFVRLGTKNSQEFGIFGREQVIYLKDVGEQTHPRKGGKVQPHPLDGPDMDDPLDRRVKLAEWITDKNNPFFAKNIVNRFWGYYMGRGLVEPLDDLRATNPASIPALLDALAGDFVAHKYDLKQLLRTIMNSRAYQLAAKATPGNKGDVLNIFYTRFGVRRLSAEQLADAIDYATGTQTKYEGLPLGTKAIQLPDSEVKSFFLDVFGRPARQITCECERTTQPNIAQALHLLSGEFLNKRMADPKGRLAKLLKAKAKLPDIIEELYYVTVCRPPTEFEMTRVLQWIGKGPNPQEGVQDFMWVLLNSREFLFNH